MHRSREARRIVRRDPRCIHGRIDLRIPESGLAGIQIRGTTGACSDNARFYEANFYGGAVYADGESLAVPVVPNISCNAKKTYVVSSIDLLALDRTKACAMSIPDAAQQPIVFAGNIRPQLLGPDFARTVFEDGPSAATMDAAGKARIDCTIVPPVAHRASRSGSTAGASSPARASTHRCPRCAPVRTRSSCR